MMDKVELLVETKDMFLLKSPKGINYVMKNSTDVNDQFASFKDQVYGFMVYNKDKDYIYAHTGTEIHILNSFKGELKIRKFKLDFVCPPRLDFCMLDFNRANDELIVTGADQKHYTFDLEMKKSEPSKFVK